MSDGRNKPPDERLKLFEQIVLNKEMIIVLHKVLHQNMYYTRKWKTLNCTVAQPVYRTAFVLCGNRSNVWPPIIIFKEKRCSRVFLWDTFGWPWTSCWWTWPVKFTSRETRDRIFGMGKAFSDACSRTSNSKKWFRSYSSYWSRCFWRSFRCQNESNK